MSHWVLRFPDGQFARGRSCISLTPKLDQARVFTSKGAARNSYPQRYSSQSRWPKGGIPVPVNLVLVDD